MSWHELVQHGIKICLNCVWLAFHAVRRLEAPRLASYTGASKQADVATSESALQS